MAVIAAIKLFAMMKAILTSITVAFTVLKTTIAVVRTGMVLFNLVFLSNPIGLVIAAIAALVAGFWALNRCFQK